MAYLVGGLLALALLVVLVVSAYKHAFVTDSFRAEEVYDHINQLAGPAYTGRLAGSKGNSKAQSYVAEYFRQQGLAPAGDNNTYYQNLKSFVPTYQAEPHLRVINSDGSKAKEFNIGTDYVENLTGYGSGGSLKGKLVYVKGSIEAYPEGQIKDKIVVARGMREQDQEYAIDHGVKGILTEASNGLVKQPVFMASKPGKSFLSIAMEPQSFAELAQLAQQQQFQADISLPIAYTWQETPNVLGKIEGRDKNSYLIICAHIDGVGGFTNDTYFPGALDGASGIGMLLELAKVMQQQPFKPEKTVIFAAWNNEKYGMAGSTYYTEHPLFPLDKTEVIVLDQLGAANIQEVLIDSSGEVGLSFANKLVNYAKDTGLTAREAQSGAGNDHSPFLAKHVPAVLVKDNLYNKYYNSFYDLYTKQDNIDNLNKVRLGSIGLALLDYIKGEVYGDNFPRYLTGREVAFISGYGLVLLLIYLITTLWKRNPKAKLLRVTVEDVYYSIPFTLISKAFFYLTPAFLIFFALVFIANVPPTFNLVRYHNTTYTNFSFYLVIKHSVLYIRNLFSIGMGASQTNMSVMASLPDAFWRSFRLLLAAISLAFCLGVAKGIWDGFREKERGGWRTAVTLFTLSLPDVLIVLLAQLGLIFINQHNLLPWFSQMEGFRRFVVPLICLTIIPTVYISRIASTAAQEEIGKDYVKVAKAKGLSVIRVIFNHVLISVVIKVVNSLGAVLTIIISNLIVVEYLCYYPGIVYGLVRFYQQNDTVSFIGFALGLGVIYVTFILLFKLAAKLINPLKKEGF